VHGGRNISLAVYIEHVTAPDRVYAAAGESSRYLLNISVDIHKFVMKMCMKDHKWR